MLPQLRITRRIRKDIQKCYVARVIGAQLAAASSYELRHCLVTVDRRTCFECFILFVSFLSENKNCLATKSEKAIDTSICVNRKGQRREADGKVGKAEVKKKLKAVE